MTIGEAIRQSAVVLAATGIDTARLDAEVLMRHVLRMDRARLFLNLNTQLREQHERDFAELISARCQGQPIAYLTGEREFMGLPFAVGPGVLVPRPETEWLVEWVVQRLHNTDAATLVDVGTGSGAIAISVAKCLGRDWPGQIIGIDYSADALVYAAINRDRFDVPPVEFIQGNLLDAVVGPIDLIVANLPYLRPEQVEGNSNLAAEPMQALVGGDDGLDLVRQLLEDAPRVLAHHNQMAGAIALELDPGNVFEAANIAGLHFPQGTVTVVKDLAGLDRYVVVEC